MSEPEVKIEWINVDLLKPNEDNPYIHTEEDVDEMVRILEFQGWRHPIICDSSYLIWAGHKRRLAAIKMGTKKVPVHIQEFESFDQAYAFMTSDNELAKRSDIDLKMVNLAIPNLGPDFDIDLLGIKDFTIDVAERGCDEDEVPEVSIDEGKAKVRSGDLFILGEHRLLCGDSTSKEAVERLMNGEKADMVFTDPPYGMNLDTDFNTQSGSGNAGTFNPKQKGKTYSPVIGDDKPYDPTFIFEYFLAVKEIFIWGGDYYYERLPPGGTFMVWDKNAGNEGADKMIGSGFEFCWTKQKHKKQMARIFYRGTFGEDKVRVHPTQKPVSLAAWFFERWGKDAKIIWDGYLGSGSTLIACHKTNRKCYGSEIDPHYIDVIVSRWMKFSGKMAYLIGDSNGELKEPVPYAEIDSFRSGSTKPEYKSTAQSLAGK